MGCDSVKLAILVFLRYSIDLQVFLHHVADNLAIKYIFNIPRFHLMLHSIEKQLDHLGVLVHRL